MKRVRRSPPARHSAGTRSRRSRTSSLTLFVVALVCGCSGRERFRSYAVYDAPAAEFRIKVLAEGTYLRDWPFPTSSEDAAKTTAVVCPLSHGRALRLELLPKGPHGFAVDAHYTVDGGASGVFKAHLHWRSEFSGLLRDAGYTLPSSDEIDEAAQVIEAMSWGPKATVQKGQTKWLRVIEVVNYSAVQSPPGFADCT